MNKETIPLERFPEFFAQVVEDVAEIKMLIQGLINPLPPEPDQWLDLNELCHYHPDKPKKATVYSWVNTRSIPVHRSSKKLRFLKSEIDGWLQQGRKKTLFELQTEATTYATSKTKGGIK